MKSDSGSIIFLIQTHSVYSPSGLFVYAVIVLDESIVYIYEIWLPLDFFLIYIYTLGNLPWKSLHCIVFLAGGWTNHHCLSQASWLQKAGLSYEDSTTLPKGRHIELVKTFMRLIILNF